MVLRLSLFAVTTLLGREPAFTGAGPCLKRGQRQHADGRLVSTRSCSLRPCARRHCGGTHLSDCKGAAVPLRWLSNRLRSAQPNPPYARRWAGATSPHQCHSGGLAGEVWQVGLSGRPPKFPSRSIQGPGLELLLPLRWLSAVATAVAQLRHCGGALPRVDPSAPLAAAFPLPCAGAKRTRPLPPSPSSQCSSPGREAGCRPCAGRENLPR